MSNGFPLCCAIAAVSTLLGSLPASAQNRGIIPAYEFGSVALDYPANVAPSGSVSLQGTLGQTFAFTAGSPFGQYPAALGFWDTGAPYVYNLAVGLDGFVGDPTGITLHIRLWNVFGQIADTPVTQTNRSGEATVRSWANPSYINIVSVKGDRWLRRAAPLVPLANPFLDYPFAAVLLLPGDVNNDNQTDRFDYNAFKIAFGSRPGDLNWTPLADLDGDGEVGRFDYNLFKLNFGMVGDN
jgi:hypothetical protein